jgi:hypothetical protein
MARTATQASAAEKESQDVFATWTAACIVRWYFSSGVHTHADVRRGEKVHKLQKVISILCPVPTFSFFKRRQKICLNLLIKKKRIAQLINRKPDKNHYNKTTRVSMS